jgi:arginase family enzyme
MMNMSGIYDKENFCHGCGETMKDEFHVIDCTGITGTDLYCDECAKKLLKEKINKMDTYGLHFIDSGNYHYISKLMLDKIKKPFVLVVFDCHPDMKDPAFGEILSCGNWVKEAVDENENLIEAELIGVKDNLIGQDMKDYRNKVDFISLEEMEKAKSLENVSTYIIDTINRIKSVKNIDDRPSVYISIDKDVLAQSEVNTNWDQGNLSLRTVEDILSYLFHNDDVVGIDICGEPSAKNPFFNEMSDANKSSQVNQRFIQFINSLYKNA